MTCLINVFLVSAIACLVLGSPLDFKIEEENPIAPRAEGDASYRLTEDVEADEYELTITPFFKTDTSTAKLYEAFTFEGIVNIKLKAKEANKVTSVVLHMNDLTISKYSWDNGLGSGIGSSLAYDAELDKLTIPIASGSFLSTEGNVLKIEYKGKMKDDMAGFYRSYYKVGSDKIWLGTTQLQSTSARRVLPCLDEPGFKAVFKLMIRRPKEMNAIANTKVASFRDEIVHGLEYVEDKFADTPKMSAYLLAFIVSNYVAEKNGNFGVYARPAAKPNTALALSFGVDMLAKFDSYLGVNYYDTMAKMDMAAIPDFSAGAMENWGLLTYRETGILYYPEDTPSINEQRIIAVIAHEQAHMWFGDLLTCKWWSYTWLNEGFARYFQFMGTAMIKTDWDLEEQFVVENLQQSMQLDSTAQSHPMTNEQVFTKKQASDMFDNISYNKAASIIRMLKYYLESEDKFKATLTRYLTDNKFKAVVPADLATAIDVISPGEAKVAEFWLPWTSTVGFPLLTVSRADKKLTISQKRFMRDTGITHSLAERYNVPINVAIDSDDYSNTKPTKIYKMSESGDFIFDLDKAPSKYYILNKQQVGYYRVNYDDGNWQSISEALHKDDHDKIHVLNRAAIVDDLFQLARAGIVKYDKAVDIIRYLKKEKSYTPWLSAINHGLTYLSQRVADKDKDTFAWFIRDLMDEIYKTLTFEFTTSGKRTDIYNRVNIMTWACKYGHDDCINKSKEKFAAFLKAPTVKIHKDQRSFVYCNGVRHGSTAEFNLLYNRFTIEDISAEQLNLLIGMACTKDTALVKKYLDRVINTEDIRNQDRAGAINNILNSNPEGPDFLFNYIKDNMAAWKTKMGNFDTLKTVAGRFTTAKQFEDLEKFLTEKKTELGDTTFTDLKSSHDTAKKTLEWDAKYMKEFMDHLNVLRNSAPIKTISMMVAVVSLVVLFLLN